MKIDGLIFLKLGGSLITDKQQPLTARLEIIRRIAQEISTFLEENPGKPLLLGHGSGSFGHSTADEYQTQDGGKGNEYWRQFSEVWHAARLLNQYVIEILTQVGLPVIAFPPSAGVIAQNKAFSSWDIRPIQFALAHNLVPVIQGDVIFDTQIGGTIFSTEKSFQYLAKKLHPSRILLAGADRGVYWDPSTKKKLISLITPTRYQEMKFTLSGSESTDVTGGMLSKVSLMVDLVQNQPELEVQIFSGIEPGNIKKSLAGDVLGTLIRV